MRRIVLTIANDRIVALRNGDRAIEVGAINSLADVERLTDMVDGDLYCASSLDFPEEYTTNPEVIALARAIRG